MKNYDLIVVGGGSGGVRCARIAQGLGAKVAIIEERDLGGTCVHRGCVPKKLFFYAAHFRHDCEDARGFGWQDIHARFDWPTLRDNKDRELERLAGIYHNILAKPGVDIITGRGELTSNRTIQVGDQELSTDRILIATGSKPALPDIPGREHFLTSDEMFHLESIPEDVVIYGGGYIAVEFAGIMQGFGCNVSLILRSDTILRQFDRETATHLLDQMAGRGIKIYPDSPVKEVHRSGDKLEVELANGRKIKCGLAMAATGRTANCQNLGLEKAGVKLTDSGHIDVNQRFQTSSETIFAVGDVIPHPQLTPVAIRQGHWLARHLFEKGFDRPAPTYDVLPSAVFSQPPLASVGLSEETAHDRGLKVKALKASFREMKHTLSGRDERCFLKMIVDQDTDRVLGIHMVGHDAAEIIQCLAVPLSMGAKHGDFIETLCLHPSVSEEIITLK